MRVDPLADQFPNQSPYLYAYNNPVRFIDVNGMYGDETEANAQRDMAIAKGLDVGEVYGEKGNYAFNVVNGEDSYTTFDKDFSPDYSAKQDNLSSIDLAPAQGGSNNGQGGFQIYGNGSSSGWSLPSASHGGATQEGESGFDMPTFIGNPNKNKFKTGRGIGKGIVNLGSVLFSDEWVNDKGAYWWQQDIPDNSYSRTRVSKNKDSLIMMFKDWDNSWDTIIHRAEKIKGKFNLNTRSVNVKDTRR